LGDYPMAKDDLTLFYNNITREIKRNDDNLRYMQYFYDSFLAGDTSIYQKSIVEYKNFDTEWIDTLEMYLPSIEKIIRNPKSTLRFDEELIIIEKARKVTPTSIRHLAANAHLIKNVDDEGNIIPNKILTTTPEIDYGIYENRFIMTLIQRLATFVGNRYEVIKSNYQSYEKRHINLRSLFDINNKNVELNVDMIVKSEVDDSDFKQRNEKLFARVAKLYNTIQGIMASPFMKELSGMKPVKPPIMKTNIILKNPDFRNAYSLWLFLDKYNALVYDIDVQEKDLDFDSKFVASLNELALLNYVYITYNQDKRKAEYALKQPTEYVRKAIKIVKVHPKDVVNNPDAIAMEDNSINEYYLDQNQKIFKKSLVDLLGDNISYEQALKTAIKQTLDISNSLYKSVFDLNPELKEEVIKTFTKEELEKTLTDAKRKVEIAKIIRETKEEDFKATLDLEKQHLDLINKLSVELFESIKKKKNKFLKNSDNESLNKETKELNIDKDLAKDRLEQLISTIETLTKLKQEIYEQQRFLKEELEKSIDKELIAAEKERAKIEREEMLKKMREERKLALLRERQMFKEAREKIRAKYRELQAKIIEEEKINRENELLKLQEQFKLRREQELQKLIQKAKEKGKEIVNN